MSDQLVITVQRPVMRLQLGAVPVSGGGGSVSSVFGRTGAVVAANGDYTAAQVGADATGTAAAAVAAHEAAGDPHPGYLTEAAAAAAYQPLDADLTALAALAGTGIARRTGAGTWTVGSLVSVAEGGTGSATAADARTALGLVIGTDVAAYDAGLASLAAVDTAADRLPYTSGAEAWTWTALTAAGRALLDDADASAQRTTLGLVAIASSGSASDLSTGTVPTARLGSGTASAGTALHGDQTWQPAWQVVTLQADASNATTTPVVTSLAFTPAANKRYAVEVYGWAENPSAGIGVQIGLSLPTGIATVSGGTPAWAAHGRIPGPLVDAEYVRAHNNADNARIAAAGHSTAGLHLYRCSILIEMGGSPSGQLAVTLTHETGASGTVYLRAGSVLLYLCLNP